MNILITTEHRGVFLAQTTEKTDLTQKHIEHLRRVKMVVKWRNGDGLPGMAKYGPTDNCKISSEADAPIIRDVTAVWTVTDEAAAKIWKDNE